MRMFLVAVLTTLFGCCAVSCSSNDIIVGGCYGVGYYIHGDTLETYNAPSSCDGFLFDESSDFVDKKSVLTLNIQTFFVC